MNTRTCLFSFLLTLTASLTLAATSSDTALTHDLDGTHITYSYDDGSTYDVKYTTAGVMYRFVSGGSPEAWWGPFPYRAFKTADGTC